MMRQISQTRLAKITGTNSPPDQCAVLRQIGVIPIVRPDGAVIVFEEVLRDAMLGRIPRSEEPDWSVFDGQAKARSA
jgi:hypothetical protein